MPGFDYASFRPKYDGMPEEKRRLTLAELFTDYEPEIRTIFDRIAREIGLVDERAVTLEFTEMKTPMLFRCVPSERRVLADWRGVASLWAISQAAARLSLAMFKARRNGVDRLDLTDGVARGARLCPDRLR